MYKKKFKANFEKIVTHGDPTGFTQELWNGYFRALLFKDDATKVALHFAGQKPSWRQMANFLINREFSTSQRGMKTEKGSFKHKINSSNDSKKKRPKL